jgi:hypothetical protein
MFLAITIPRRNVGYSSNIFGSIRISVMAALVLRLNEIRLQAETQIFFSMRRFMEARTKNLKMIPNG